MMEDREWDGRVCPRCENEEICCGANYCKICGLPLSPKTMIKINSIEDMIKHDLPPAILADIDGRIRDWLASGGSMNDDYIKQQYRFAENWLNRKPRQM